MLECKDLEFSYDGKNKVLSGVTLSFEKGKFYGIFGPNGSGKSTLLKLLTGELKSRCGTVFPRWCSALERARYIALVEQQIPAALPLTVAETAALGRYPWEQNGENDEKDDKKLRETCQEFESMFVNLMLKEMRKTIPESDFMPQSFATQTFEEMYDEEIAKSVSKGKGIGIADAMYRQMSYQLSKQYKVEE